MSYRQRVDDLIVEIQNSDSLPISQQTFQTANIAQFMDDALHSEIVPQIVKTREEFFVTSYSTVIGPGTVTLPIPGGAAGFRVRDCYMYDPASGNTDFNQTITGRATRFNPDTIGQYVGSVIAPNLFYGTLPRFYIENNVIKFFPALQVPYLAKLRVLQAPNHLVEYNRCCGQVTGLIGNNTVTVDNVPQGSSIPVNTGGLGDWTKTTGGNATTLDVLQPNMPFNFRTSVTTGWALISKSIIAVNGNTVTLDSDTYNSIQLGDFLVTTQCSPFIQYCPFEAYNLIKMLTSIRILKAQGDIANMALAMSLYNQSSASFLGLITPKVEGTPKKIGAGQLGMLGGRGWWGWGR